MIKNIIFDLGNVLVPISIERVQAAIIKLLKDPKTDVRQILNTIHRYEMGAISTPAFINGILRLSSPQTQAIDVINAWNSVFDEFPTESLDLLEEMNAAYRVYILSNTNELHIDYVNRHLKRKYGIDNLRDLVYEAYYSHEMQLKKPDKRIYETILEKEGLVAEESIFIDDLKENVLAAESCGLHVIWLQTFAEAKPLLNKYLEEKKIE